MLNSWLITCMRLLTAGRWIIRAADCWICTAVFEKADDVFHLINAADKALDNLDAALHDWEYLGNVTRLPLWLRAIYRRTSELVSTQISFPSYALHQMIPEA